MKWCIAYLAEQCSIAVSAQLSNDMNRTLTPIVLLHGSHVNNSTPLPLFPHARVLLRLMHIIACAGAFSAAPPPGLPPPAPVVDVAAAFQKLLLAASGVLYEDTYLQARPTHAEQGSY